MKTWSQQQSGSLVGSQSQNGSWLSTTLLQAVPDLEIPKTLTKRIEARAARTGKTG